MDSSDNFISDTKHIVLAGLGNIYIQKCNAQLTTLLREIFIYYTGLLYDIKTKI
jgi:hypothetical protein